MGSVQVFYPLLNYLSSSPEFLELVANEWNGRSKTTNTNDSAQDDVQKAANKANQSVAARKQAFDGN